MKAIKSLAKYLLEVPRALGIFIILMALGVAIALMPEYMLEKFFTSPASDGKAEKLKPLSFP